MVDLSREFLKLAWKYGSSVSKSKQRAKQQIEELYSLKYPDKESEMIRIRDHESRTADSIVFSTLVIYVANRGEKSKYNPGAMYVSGSMINIAKVASNDDDFHDEILVPYIVRQGGWSVGEIYNLIRDYEKSYNFSLTLGPVVHPKTRELLIPSDLVGASWRVEKYFEEEVRRIDDKAYNDYKGYLELVQKSQAKDIALYVASKIDDRERIFEIIGPNLEKLHEMHDKLAYIGEGGAVVANDLSWVDRPRKSVEEENEKYRTFFPSLTRSNQAGYDDGNNVVEDTESKSPNIFVLRALPECRTVNKKEIRDFYSRRPKVPSEILWPSIEATANGLKNLSDSDAYGDFKLGFEWSMKRVKKSMKDFEKALGVKIDWTWWDEYKRLRNTL